ncbi:hypothetical protein [Wolbachia endosymbiont (group E) of Neria commutata]|uniref:hypothetical protein n=1 Tax=Wolbachia endosymbiont (group E) of Neria commutata TaxID=3066149 RepID=UPI003132AD29
MLGDLISFNGEFHKSVKKLLKYIEVNNPSKEELDELRDQFVENAILDIERTHGTKEIKGFESIEEIKKHLKQEEDKCNSKQLSRTAKEHGHAKRKIIDDNNNMLSSGDPLQNKQKTDEKH